MARACLLLTPIDPVKILQFMLALLCQVVMQLRSLLRSSSTAICVSQISLIKSTNVQIMQDVLKYGKHLNIL